MAAMKRSSSAFDRITSYNVCYTKLLRCAQGGAGPQPRGQHQPVLGPGEGLALAIAETIPKECGRCKIGVDSGMVIMGVLSSFALLHSLQGVREGTILAALGVGFLARLFGRWFPVVDVWLGNTEIAVEAEQDETMVVHAQRLVITISRES